MHRATQKSRTANKISILLIGSITIGEQCGRADNKIYLAIGSKDRTAMLQSGMDELPYDRRRDARLMLLACTSAAVLFCTLLVGLILLLAGRI